MWNIILWASLFIIGYIIIFFSADIFIDNLKEICLIYKISPFIIGLLVLGIDPEESIASIVAALNGMPYIAIGNIIGNSIIALTLCFALPAFFHKIEIESIPHFYFFILYTSMLIILLSFLVYNSMFIFGIVALLFYGIYIYRNLRNLSKKNLQKVIIKEKNIEINNIDPNVISRSFKIKKIAMIVLSLTFIFIGGELLIFSAKELITLTNIPETFFGFVIIAFITNVEELTLIIKSIKKQSIEIGFGGMIGKLIWNLTITYGISAIITRNIEFLWILLWNWLILMILIVYFNIISKKRSITIYDGLILSFFFIIFLLINISSLGIWL